MFFIFMFFVVGQALFAAASNPSEMSPAEMSPAETLELLMWTPEPLALTKAEVAQSKLTVARPDNMSPALARQLIQRFGLSWNTSLIKHSSAMKLFSEGKFLPGFHWIDTKAYKGGWHDIRWYYHPPSAGYVVTSMKPKGVEFSRKHVALAAKHCYVSGGYWIDNSDRKIRETDVKNLMKKLVPGGLGIVIIRHGSTRIDVNEFYQPGFNFKLGAFYEDTTFDGEDADERAFSVLFITKQAPKV